MREDAWRGEPVTAVFENLLPDSVDMRRRVAEKVGAAGYDTYSILAAVGRDCVGALQFIAGDATAPEATTNIAGEQVDDEAIGMLLKSLAQAPLGLSRDDDFRISIAGAQEKTALLRIDGQWIKPHGTTPTTHLFKTQIGKLPNGIDFPNSVENEFYCLRLLKHLGLPVNRAEIMTFARPGAGHRAVRSVLERWSFDPFAQEDCCQALSVPPSRKYQNEAARHAGDRQSAQGADSPADDHRTLFQAQLVFWLIGATDGHAKNFSIFLHQAGLCIDAALRVLSAQPNVDARQIERKQMKLAMSVGKNNHYRIDEIQSRHFFQTGEAAGLSRSLVRNAAEDVAVRMDAALASLEAVLPADFPQHCTILSVRASGAGCRSSERPRSMMSRADSRRETTFAFSPPIRSAGAGLSASAGQEPDQPSILPRYGGLMNRSR